MAMIDAAERQGLLQPGGTIVEPTSGNTGVGLAIVAAQRGYRCIFVMSDKMSDEKVALLRAYGAQVVVCPTAVPPEAPDSYYSVADRLTRETPNSFRPNQYYNQANPAEHERSTGPEMWRQTAGRITHFVAGVGTGGTITGVARYLKRQNPDIQVIAADPEGSVFSGGTGRPYLVEGVGEDFWPPTYDPSVVDRTIRVIRRGVVRRRAARHAGGGAADRRVVWHRRARRARRRRRARLRRPGRRAPPRLGARVHLEDLQRRLDDQLRVPHPGRRDRRRRAGRQAGRGGGGGGPRRRHPRRAGPAGLRHDARPRRQPARRERHHRAAPRGQGGVGDAQRA